MGFDALPRRGAVLEKTAQVFHDVTAVACLGFRRTENSACPHAQESVEN